MAWTCTPSGISLPICLSRARWLKQRMPSSPSPTTAAPTSGSDIQRSGRPSPLRVSECVIQADDGCWRVLSCSGLVPVKRVDRLVRGLADLGRRNPERQIHWTHLGDGAQRTVIEALAQAALPPNVSWQIAGHIPNWKVLAYYEKNPVDVFVNVSESEGVPVAMMEAQSRGVGIVATAVGGVPEIVVPGSGVLLEASAAPGDLATGLQHVCEDAEGSRLLRSGARRSWQVRYDAATNYGIFVDVLDGIAMRQPIE